MASLELEHRTDTVKNTIINSLLEGSSGTLRCLIGLNYPEFGGKDLLLTFEIPTHLTKDKVVIQPCVIAVVNCGHCMIYDWKRSGSSFTLRLRKRTGFKYAEEAILVPILKRHFTRGASGSHTRHAVLRSIYMFRDQVRSEGDGRKQSVEICLATPLGERSSLSLNRLHPRSGQRRARS